MEEVKLICPKCGVEYTNYREYFACWTSHLNEATQGNSFPPSDHNEAIKHYKRFPEDIEQGLRILASEVGVFHGRIDLIGVDRDKNLVIIDVTTGVDWKRKVEQMRKYQKNIEWMGQRIFGLRQLPKIRLLLVKPNDYAKDVTHYVGDNGTSHV